MTTQILGKNCDGGHYTCSPPKECCKQGCCYLVSPSIYRPPTVPSGNLLNPLFLGHWYFWIAVTATVAGILCACSIWRRHNQNSLFCCRDNDNNGRDERASEPDSNGSCYLPPQYSRCNSFHQAPPPYSEVTSKPDLYPLVISYNGDHGIKNNNTTNGYSMVQYFRNFIVRPVGTLSATSTIDSLSSSFICNAANEANTIIPPPYSCMGSLEEVVTSQPQQQQQQQQLNEERTLQHSASSISGIELHPTIHNSASTNSNLSIPLSRQNTVSITDNPCFGQNSTSINVNSNNNNNVNNNNNNSNNGTCTVPNNLELVADSVECKSQNNCDETTYKTKKPNSQHLLQNERSQDSESQDDDQHNFADLLNLSLCLSNQTNQTIINQQIRSSTSQHLHEFSVTNSITDSDISSLANLGTPDSPPQATSPTLEMKEILDKIQQLPQQKSPTVTIATTTTTTINEPKFNKNYFHRSKAKTLYMPLHCNDTENSNVNNNSRAKSKIFTRGWLSRSAPTTPCGNFVPTFPIHYHHHHYYHHHHHHHKKNGSNSQRNSRSMLNDGSPLLLKEHEESEEDANKDECL